jgi:uncharacterized protein (DUF1800 family)
MNVPQTAKAAVSRAKVNDWWWLALSLLILTLVAVTAPANAQNPAGSPMGFDDARHVLNRTSFAAQISEINEFAKLTRTEAVDRLLAETRRQASYPPPAWSQTYARPFRPDMTQEERMKANRRELVERGLELRTWWVAEMLSTSSPFTERMTLFWHNHFATSQQKSRSATLMYRQNVLFRKYSTGNFAAMLREVGKDPAMLIYLDGAQNRKGAPNENFAREVMELFTLGEGHYTEQDVKEAARAFTGWSIDGDTGEFRFRRAIHDDGVKKVLGQEGRFNGDDMITILLQQPATGEFIVGKLWREFVSPDTNSAANTAAVKKLAADWRAANYEIKPLLREMLLSDAFWAPENRGVLVKSPVDLVIGSLRQFRFSVEDPAPFAVILRQLGQDLFNPPNVKGWPGGETWLNTTTLLARKGFLNRLFRADEMVKPGAVVTAMNPSTMDAKPLGQPIDSMAMTGQSTAQLMDKDLVGANRQRAQMRLAARGTDSGMTAALPAFGVANQLRGQYFFSAEQWFAQQPKQREMNDDIIWRTVLAGPPVQAAKDVPPTLIGLRSLALDPMYQLK